jgi:hypothetical protein
MEYSIVVTPETFHKFDKHNMQHVCVPMVIGNSGIDVAMEVFNGILKAVEARFEVEKVSEEKDECDEIHTLYKLRSGEKEGLLHIRLRKVTPDCPLISGNRCSIFEFERDIECVVDGIEECLS